MRATVMLGWLAACDAGRAPTPPPLDPAVVRFVAGFSPTLVGALAPEPVIAGDYGMALDMSFDMFITPEMRTLAARHGVFTLTLGADHRIHGCVAMQRDEGAEGQYHYEPDPKKRLGYRGHHDARVAAIGGSWKIVADIANISIDRMWPGGCVEAGPAPVTPDNLAALIELQCIATKMTRLLPGHTLLCQEPAGDPLGLGMPLAAPMRNHLTAPTGKQLVLAPGGLAMKYVVANQPDVTFSIVRQPVMIDPAAYK